MYVNLYYDHAIRHYKTALKKEPNNDFLKLKIAKSYNKLGDYRESALWFGAMEDSLEIRSENKMIYANALMSVGDYHRALFWYDQYMSEYPEDDRPLEMIRGIEMMETFFRDSVVVSVHNLNINTEHSDFAAVPYEDGIVYVTSRGLEGIIDHDYLREEPLLNLYYSRSQSLLDYEHPEPFDKVLNTKYHEGPVSFYGDGDKMVFTRNNFYRGKSVQGSDGRTNIQLYFASKAGTQWVSEQPFEHNSPNSSFGQPSITSGNDTLYFSSNMPGGLGGNDIYFSTWDGSGWSEPTNVGAPVNTGGDEMYPYYVDGRLFFTSNGHAGIGGLDVFKAFRDGNGFRSVTNLGYPLNSSDDDFAYHIDAETLTGYVSSNREGGAGLEDIYAFQYTGHPINGVVLETVDKIPVGGATVQLFDDEGNHIGTTLTRPNGQFHFQLPFGREYSMIALKDGYFSTSGIEVLSSKSVMDLDTLSVDLTKQLIFAQGEIYDNETQGVMNNVRVVITDLRDNSVDSLRTNDDGHYIFPLKPGRKYRIRADKDHFLPFEFEITTTEINEGVIRNDIVLEEEYVDKEVIYFAYNKFNLDRESMRIMSRLVPILKKYPETWLVIGAHADARGTREYNLELSQSRADATVNYFLGQGISRDRIIARAFGEELHINRCYDGINCTEELHSKNRRSEMKIELQLPEEELDENFQRR